MTWDLEIKAFVPFNQLINYPDEDKDEFIENPKFKIIRDFLEIDVDVESWARECYEILEGNKELEKIQIYYSNDQQSYIILDSYFDPIDQLDLVNIGFKTFAKNGNELRKFCRSFYDECVYNIDYSEGTNAIFEMYPIDDNKFKYYKEIPKSEYLKGKKIEKIKTAHDSKKT